MFCVLRPATVVEAFEGFHDLEDDDGDEDEEEDYRLSWDLPSSAEEVDEPDNRKTHQFSIGEFFFFRHFLESYCFP